MKKSMRLIKSLLFSFIFIGLLITFPGKGFALSNEVSITTGTAVSGQLDSESDVDYYKFILSSPGKVSVNFRHIPVSSGDWEIQIWDSQYTQVDGSYFTSGSSNSTLTSNNVRLPAGTYYVKVNKRPYYSFSNANYTLTVNFMAEGELCEKNPDGNPSVAYAISLNTAYTGNLDSEIDVDYYNFNLSSPGKVSVNFRHIPVDSGDWEIRIWDSQYTPMAGSCFTSGPTDSTVTSNNVRLPAGTYFMKVNKRPYYSFNNADYTFTVNFTAEDELYEKNPNDHPLTAYPINLNTAYTGNLDDENDVDYYTFSLSSSANASVNFGHIPVNSGDWEIQIWNSQYTQVNGSCFTSRSDESTHTSNQIMLPAGTYFVKVNKRPYYSFNNADYTLTVNGDNYTSINSTQIISNTIPAGMTTGQSRSVAITVKNDGSSTWTAADGYKLGAVGDSDHFAAIRQTLDNSDSIAPGQSKTFVFTMTAPAEPRTYTTDWQMLCDGTGWFGQTIEVNVNVTAASAAQIMSDDGQLDNESDVDYYSFTLPSPGKAAVEFRHIPVSSGDWEVQITDSQYTQINGSYFTSGSGDSIITSNNVRLPAGNYFVKVNKRPYYSFNNVDYSVAVNFTAEGDSYEKNPNGDPMTAYPVSLNTAYTGDLDSEDDVDYYSFTLPSPGKAAVEFRHIPVSSGDWEIQIWDFQYTQANGSCFTSGSADSTMKSNSLRLPAGTYYLKVNKRPYYSFSNTDYTFTVNFTTEGDSNEKNPNEDPMAAYPINLNTAYTGDLDSESDVDYYTFTLGSAGKVSVNFRHIPVSSGDWEIQIWDSQFTQVDGSCFNSGSDHSTMTSNEVTLPAGTYYLKVNKRPYYSFSNVDYILTVNGDNPAGGGSSETWMDWNTTRQKSSSDYLTIAFNKEVDGNTANNTNIFVATDTTATNRVSSISVTPVSGNTKQVRVFPPYGGWEPGRTYYLFISKEIKSTSGQMLQNGIRMTFSVTNDESNFGVTITGTSTPEVLIGGQNQSASDIMLNEVMPGSIVAGKYIDLALPAGVTFYSLPAATVVSGDLMLNTQGLSLNNQNGSLRIPIITSSSLMSSQIEISNVKLNIASTVSPGDINITAGGTAGVTGNVKIANCIVP